MSSRTIVTGFGPFANVADNPSAHLAEASNCPFKVLEVAYEAVDAYLFGLDQGSFDHLLMLGVAASRKRPSLELYARNVKKGKDMRGRDESGVIEAGGPLLLEATIWAPDTVADLVAENLGLGVSMDAGAYLCNYISYRALRLFPEKLVGFLHVVMPAEVDLEQQGEMVRQAIARVEVAS